MSTTENAEPISMQDFANLKKLVQALEELDDAVIATAQHAIAHLSLTKTNVNRLSSIKDDIRLLEISRAVYRDSDYSLATMLQYLRSLPEFQRTWSSMLTLTIEDYSMNRDIRLNYWAHRTQTIQETGDEAWKLAIPASKVIGDEILNSLIRKFQALDRFMDQLWPMVHMGSTLRRKRFSEELSDSM